MAGVRKARITKAEIAARVRAGGERARREAEERRKLTQTKSQANEIGGQKGPEPTRYGDWEKNGIVSDF